MSQQSTPQEPLVGEVRFRVPLPIVIPSGALASSACSSSGFAWVLLSIPTEAATVIADRDGGQRARRVRLPRSSAEGLQHDHVRAHRDPHLPAPDRRRHRQHRIRRGRGSCRAGAAAAEGAGCRRRVAARSWLRRTRRSMSRSSRSRPTPRTRSRSTTRTPGSTTTCRSIRTPTPGSLTRAPSSRARSSPVPITIEYTFQGPEKGEYYFQCDVHPNMNGTAHREVGVILAHGEAPAGASLSDILGRVAVRPVRVARSSWCRVALRRGRAGRRPRGPRCDARTSSWGCSRAGSRWRPRRRVRRRAVLGAHGPALLLVLVAAPLLALGAPVALALRASLSGRRGGAPDGGPRLSGRAIPQSSRRDVGVVRRDAVAQPPVRHLRRRAREPRGSTASSTSSTSALRSCSGSRSSDWIRGRGKLSPPARVAYLARSDPDAICSSVSRSTRPTASLYPHYSTLDARWGPAPIDDQNAAALLMWLGRRRARC